MKERAPLSRRRRIFGTGAAVAVVLASLALFVSSRAMRGDEEGGFNERGNVLITDQFNNRVIEVNPNTHQVVWQFGDGSYIPGPHSIVGVNDAERVGKFTLMAGTGTPAGADPSCPLANGCPDNRVMLVNEEGEIVWQYGQAGVAGSGPDQLNTPVQNTFLPNGHILITDQLNERVIEVTRHKHIVWQYGTTGVIGSGQNQLSNPNSAELLRNGHILIADENNNRAIEVTHTTPSTIVATFTAQGSASGVAFASRLPNGNTLLTDSNNNRIVEVDPGDNPVFQYLTNSRPNSNPSPLPTRAVLLRNGLILISDQFNDQVIAIDRSGNVVWSQGQIDTSGNNDGSGFNQLNAPYSAYVIGDYTGLTNPHRDDGDHPDGGQD